MKWPTTATSTKTRVNTAWKKREKLYRTGLASPSKVYEIWAAEFEVCYQEGGYYSLTCHPQVIGRRHRAQMLEKLIAYIKSFSDVWIARHMDIAKYILETKCIDRP